MALANPNDVKGTPVNLVESNSRPGGVALVNPYATNRASDPMDLVELARTIQKGDDFTKATAGSKLTIIADQIRYLQEQARKVLEQARRDTMLHHAACNVVKKPGQLYYLYERDSGQKYFSLLSPQEWGPSCPHTFLAAFRLESDMSWTPIDELEQRSEQFAMIDKVLSSQKAIMDVDSVLGLKKPETSSDDKVSDISAQNKES